MKNELQQTELDAREAARTIFEESDPDARMHTWGFTEGWEAARQFYQPKWVRIEDGLPDKDGHYLAQIDPKYSSVPITTEVFSTETNRFHNTHVLAWMPLPEPFRQEKQPLQPEAYDPLDDFYADFGK